MVSLWRDAEALGLMDRVGHLMAKTCAVGALSWLWCVGDCADQTGEILMKWAAAFDRVTVLQHDTHILGSDFLSARRRMSAAATVAFAAVPKDVDFVCLHESDLRSAPTVVDRLMASGKMPVAGWPTIQLPGGQMFYDVWAYRGLDGATFGQGPPYHADYTANAPFEVGSFGSCWLAPAALVRGRVMTHEAIVELCGQWRAEEQRLWVDPRVAVEQPTEYWTGRAA